MVLKSHSYGIAAARKPRMDSCFAAQRVVSGVSTPRLAEEEGRPAHAGRAAQWCT